MGVGAKISGPEQSNKLAVSQMGDSGSFKIYLSSGLRPLVPQGGKDAWKSDLSQQGEATLYDLPEAPLCPWLRGQHASPWTVSFL